MFREKPKLFKATPKQILGMCFQISSYSVLLWANETYTIKCEPYCTAVILYSDFISQSWKEKAFMEWKQPKFLVQDPSIVSLLLYPINLLVVTSIIPYHLPIFSGVLLLVYTVSICKRNARSWIIFCTLNINAIRGRIFNILMPYYTIWTLCCNSVANKNKLKPSRESKERSWLSVCRFNEALICTAPPKPSSGMPPGPTTAYWCGGTPLGSW